VCVVNQTQKDCPFLNDLKAAVEESSTSLEFMQRLAAIRRQTAERAGSSLKHRAGSDERRSTALASQPFTVKGESGEIISIYKALKDKASKDADIYWETKVKSRLARWQKAAKATSTFRSEASGSCMEESVMPTTTIKPGELWLLVGGEDVVFLVQVWGVFRTFINGMRPFPELALADVESVQLRWFDHSSLLPHLAEADLVLPAAGYILCRTPQLLISKFPHSCSVRSLNGMAHATLTPAAGRRLCAWQAAARCVWAAV
jgi:hypothetical protein